MRALHAVPFALMAIVLAVSVLRLDAAADEPLLSTITGDEDAAGKRCCDKGCVCTRSIPPHCHCVDVKDHCNPGCKDCICNPSNPPLCRCLDVLPFCPKPCPGKKL